MFFTALQSFRMKAARVVIPATTIEYDWFSPPALRHHVLHVVERRTEKEVVWVYARRDIAAVTNEHPFWDFAAVQFPRYPVCPNRMLTAMGAHFKLTVA